MVSILEAALGLTLLLVSGDFLVRGAIAVAQRLCVSKLMIGLTVVAFGTSAPEFVTSLAAAMRDLPGMAVGNIVGSNLANCLLVIGVAALARPFEYSVRAARRDGMAMLFATLLFAILALAGGIAPWHGAILLCTLFVYLGASYRHESQQTERDNPMAQEIEEIKGIPAQAGSAFLIVFAAMAGLVIGSRLLVSGGVDIAMMFGVPDEVIGLTLIALGTSLPELATVVMASIRRHGDVAIGNVVGSNIFNLLAIGGGVAMLRPLTVPPQILHFDLWAMLAVTVLIVAMMFRSSRVTRPQGGFLALAYIVYIGAQFGPLRKFIDL